MTDSRKLTSRQASCPLYRQGLLLHARQALPTELFNVCNTLNRKCVGDGGLTRGGPLQWVALRLRAEATGREPEGAAGGPALSLAAANMEQGRTASPGAALQLPDLPQLPVLDLRICMRRSGVDSQEEQAVVQIAIFDFRVLHVSKTRGNASYRRQERVHACLPEVPMSCVVSVLECQLSGLYALLRECLCRLGLLCGADTPGD